MTIDKTARFLAGEPIDKVNQLMQEIIKSNEIEIPVVRNPRNRWRVLVVNDPNKWYFIMEDGTVLLSKDILTRLSKNELTALLSIQAAHILAKHYTEYASHTQLVNYIISFVAGVSCFFTPIIYSYYVDIPVIVASLSGLSYLLGQPKFLSLLKEADRVGLRIASKQNVTPEDFVSLFEKLKEAQKKLPFTSRLKGKCYFDKRIKSMQELKLRMNSPIMSEVKSVK
jgi:Zn-dependent protease with chaperone function